MSPYLLPVLDLPFDDEPLSEGAKERGKLRCSKTGGVRVKVSAVEGVGRKRVRNCENCNRSCFTQSKDKRCRQIIIRAPL